MFAVVGAWSVGTVPPVHVDEGWNASPGDTLFREARFATPLFEGYFGAERHWFGFLPVYPILVGLSLHLFGFGLVQARAASLVLATLALALSWLAGRRLLGPRAALAALALLSLWPVAAPMPFLRTGIPLLDLGRLVRYDVAVPVFGLAALLVLARPLSAGEVPAAKRLVAAGLLVAASSLSHAYGAAWFAGLSVGLLWVLGRRGLRPVGLLGAGFVAGLLPWVLFAVSSIGDFQAQNAGYVGRIELFRPGFYLENLSSEPSRFGPVLAAARSGSPAAVLFALSCAAGFLLLARRAVRAADPGARLLVALNVTFLLSFAALLRPKMFWYLGTVWPLLALVAASFLGAASELKTRRGLPIGTWAATGLLGVGMLQGSFACRRLLREAAETTPYSVVASRLRRAVPPEGRLLLQPHWWLAVGRRAGPTQSLFVPLFLAYPRYTSTPVAPEATFRRYPPELVLLDETTRAFLAEKPGTPEGKAIREGVGEYLAKHRSGVTVVDGGSYGPLEVVRLSPPSAGPLPGKLDGR